MRKTSRKQTRKRNRNPQKNQRSQSQRVKKKKSEAGNNAPQRNLKISIRNEFEVSPQFFWAECSKRWPSALHFRSNIQPNYQNGAPLAHEASGETWEISVKRRNLLGFVWRNRFPSGILFLKLEILRDAQRDH